jgi:hypothetical protein
MAHRASLPLPKDKLDAEIKVAEALWNYALAVRQYTKDADIATVAARWATFFKDHMMAAVADVGRAQRRAEKKQTKGGKR